MKKVNRLSKEFTDQAICPALYKLFLKNVKQLLWTEKVLGKLLPRTAKAAASGKLAAIITNQITNVDSRSQRLERILSAADSSARGKKSITIEFLSNKCVQICSEIQHGPVRDAAIISVYQKIAHYQMASCQWLAAVHASLGENPVRSVFSVAFQGVKTLDHLLTDAAHTTINFDAAIDQNKFLIEHYPPHDL